MNDAFRLIFFLSPFIGAHVSALLLTCALFKFVTPKTSAAKHILPLWKLGPLVYMGMTIIQMIVENYYLKWNLESRLSLRLATDIIIGWSAFFGMITFYISSRETYAFFTKTKTANFFPVKLIHSDWMNMGIVICFMGLLVTTAILTIVNSSIVDVLRGEFAIYHVPLLAGGLILYSFFSWCLEEIQKLAK